MKNGQQVVIAGGSGLIGRALARVLVARGDRVVVLTRRAGGAANGWEDAEWDGRSLGEWTRHLDGADAVVNLAGRTVDCVKTPDNRDEILRSRVEATRALGEACRSIGERGGRVPAVWVQMSTAHIYGDPPTRVCTEDSPPGLGLAPEVGRAWEVECERACPAGTRRVVLRTGFVLAREGGAYPRLRSLARVGLGGTVGSGTQGMSWLHADDMTAILLRAIDDDSMSGVYIASGPNPVSNRAFMHALRRSIGVPIGLPAPAPLVRLGAPLLMRTDPELALYGRYCEPRRLVEEGFGFRFGDLDAALADLARR